MNYKMPKNQTQYIPGSNPLGNPSLPSPKGKKINARQEQMQKQIMQSQEKIMMLYARRLTKRDRELLQDFVTKQYRVGSSIFNSLPLVLKELILKLNLDGLTIMRSHTKNPFMKLYLSFSAWSLNSLLKNLNKATAPKKVSSKTKGLSKSSKGKKEEAGKPTPSKKK